MILDLLIGGLIVSSGCLGYVRGLCDEAMRAITWGGSLLGAYGCSYFTPSIIQAYVHSLLLTRIISGFVAFLGLFFGLKIFRYFIGHFIRKTPLAGLDQFFGIFFGIARGIVIGLVVYIFSGIFLPEKYQSTFSQPFWHSLSQNTVIRSQFCNENILSHHHDFKKASTVENATFNNLVEIKVKKMEKTRPNQDAK